MSETLDRENFSMSVRDLRKDPFAGVDEATREKVLATLEATAVMANELAREIRNHERLVALVVDSGRDESGAMRMGLLVLSAELSKTMLSAPKTFGMLVGQIMSGKYELPDHLQAQINEDNPGGKICGVLSLLMGGVVVAAFNSLEELASADKDALIAEAESRNVTGMKLFLRIAGYGFSLVTTGPEADADLLHPLGRVGGPFVGLPEESVTGIPKEQLH